MGARPRIGMTRLLSQVATATTSREAALLAMLRRANENLRSAYSIAERQGERANWDAFATQLHNTLLEQHRVLYPDSPIYKPTDWIAAAAKECADCAIVGFGEETFKAIIAKHLRVGTAPPKEPNDGNA